MIKYAGEHSPCYDGANGLGDDFVRTVCEDIEGTLWVGTNGAGLTKLAGEAWLSYTRAQGFADENIVFVVESHGERIYACTERGGVFEIREGRAALVDGSDAPPFATLHKRIAQDAHGRWWLGAGDGLYRTRGPELDLTNVERISAAGVPELGVTQVASLGPDGEGGIWIGTNDGALLRFDADGRAERVLAPRPGEAIARMLNDRRRTLWVAMTSGAGRVRDGRIDALSPVAGLPEVSVRALFEDRRGWLWFGLRTKGVSLLRDATSEPLSFENRSTNEGLASDTVWSICEGADGAMYLGTGRGLDRIDLETNAVEHLGSLGGAGGEIVNHCRCDSRGDVWIATSSGLARYSPSLERERPQAPPIWISRVRVGGVEQPVGERGVRELVLPDLGAGESHLEIEFTGASFLGEHALKYRWRLDGLDADWRAPTATPSVDLVQLGADRYRFRVQALSRNGIASAQEASVVFRILPPLWQRWWLVATASLVLAAIIFALHRTRVARAVAMERVRRQIALDLHDDLGAGLAQIAIQSEVAKREREPGQRLDAIASTARALRESMSDIVWSVDPRKDHVVDLVQRMRQVALDVLQAEGLRVEFRAPQAELLERLDLAPDRRRHVLLMFKELVTNVARHAQAGEVEIAVELAGARMSLLVRDDGRGFDAGASHAGHGLDNLRKRAAELGAELAIESQPGAGTRIRVDLPLRGRPGNGRAP